MHRFLARHRSVFLGALLAAGACSAHAGFVWANYTAVQDVTLPSSVYSNPPTLSTAVAGAQSRFMSNMAVRGSTGFEDGPSLNVSFDNGAATATLLGDGSVRVSGAALPNPLLGRYNMTGGLPQVPNPNGTGTVPDPGHWLETARTFSYAFDPLRRVSAFGFFATDLGDFDGGVTIELWRGGNRLEAIPLETVVLDANGNLIRRSNGNLTFFGVIGDTEDDWFDTVRFNIRQDETDPDLFDFIGVDEVIIGRSLQPSTGGGTTPTPGTLALAGLALTALGALTRRRARSV